MPAAGSDGGTGEPLAARGPAHAGRKRLPLHPHHRRGLRAAQDFDPEVYLGRGFGMYSEGAATPVRIELSREAARAVREKEWHPSQRLERNNGKVVLAPNARGLPEVARWVLYHAPNARALEPQAPKSMVAEFARRIPDAHR